MAEVNSVFHPSYEKLRALSNTAQSSITLTLPERPSNSATASGRYLNGAINMLSESAEYLHGDGRYLEHHLDKLDDRVERLETKVDRIESKVDDNFKYIQKQFKAVKEDVKAVKEDVKAVKVDLEAVKQDVKAFKEDVNRRFDEAKRDFNQLMAFSRNRLVQLPQDQIERVFASSLDDAGQWRNEVAPDFPTTVGKFWKLIFNVSKLQRLAKHYSVDGWQDWKAYDEENDDATQYEVLEDAVAAHPEMCHRALGVKWGLEYGHLKRPFQYDARPSGTKRKADDESQSRRVRATYRGRSETEISISATHNGHTIMRRRTTVSEPDVRVPPQTTLADILREYRVPGHRQLSEESAELRWSTSSMGAARHQLRAAAGLGPPSSGGESRA